MAHQLPRPDSCMLLDIVSVPNSEHIDGFEKEIRTFVRNNRMAEEVYESRKRLVKLIADYVKSADVGQKLASRQIAVTALTAFGSFASHCATKDSDLDLCVSAQSERGGDVAVTVLEAIDTDLQWNPEMKEHFAGHTISEIVFVRSAKVPIIKFKIDGISVDLSAKMGCSVPHATLAARYINAHCRLDERFEILVVFLKTWMRSEASAGDFLREYPNSYSLILMLIHCLQWYGIMPNLLEDNPAAAVEWTAGLSVVQLLKVFATHYSDEGMLSGYQLNMESGAVEERSDTFPSIRIVDYYDKRNPARTARSSEKFCGALRELLKAIERPTGDLFERVFRIPQELNSTTPPPPRQYRRPNNYQSEQMSPPIYHSTSSLPSYFIDQPHMFNREPSSQMFFDPFAYQ